MPKRFTRVLLVLLLLLVAVPAGALAYWGWQTDREYRSQLDFARSYLREVATTDAPSPQWLAATSAFDARSSLSKERLFLFLKVWLAASGVDAQDLETISIEGPGLRADWPYVMPVMPAYKNGKGTTLRLDVGSSRAPMQALISGAGEGTTIFLGLGTLSDCTFDPDWDQDGDIDLDDVAAARRENLGP